jgi:hypothetical protein
MKTQPKVEVGQRYQSLGAVTRAPVFTYRVAQLFESKFDHVEYARLEQVDDPTRSKSIAATALLNPRYFKPVDGQISDEPNQAA